MRTSLRPPSLDQRIASLWNAIGNTPMVEIHARFHGRSRRVFAKLESENFTGSIKDRMALHILESAEAAGELESDTVIAEASSGNTGISFAALGRALGLPVRIFMPDWMSRERRLVIESLGATIVSVSSEQGGFPGSIELANQFADENEHVLRPQQFANHANVEAHRRSTGPEILAQLEAIDRIPTAFVAGVGTGGTLVGVGEVLRERSSSVAVHPLEPANSPTMRTGFKSGTHRIQGISDDFVPPILHVADWNRIVDVWDGDAICMARRLASELGLAVGISSGANFLGALSIADEQGAESTAVTVFADSNKKYLSTDLMKPEPVLAHYLTAEIELVDFRVLPRLAAPPH